MSRLLDGRMQGAVVTGAKRPASARQVLLQNGLSVVAGGYYLGFELR